MLPKVWYALLKDTYPSANIFAFGDTLQIGFVDRTDSNITEVDWPEIFHCTLTRRCPKDATARRPNFGYPAATTTSTETGVTEIIRSGDAVTEYLSKDYDKELPVIVLYQDDKKRIKKALPEVNVATVHESQGATYDETIIIITDRPAKLHKKVNYMNVADTRHRKKVTYITETTEIEENFEPPKITSKIVPSAPPMEPEVVVDLTKPPPVKGSPQDKLIRQQAQTKKTSTEDDIFAYAMEKMKNYDHKKDDFVELNNIKLSIDKKIIEEGMDITKIDSWRMIDRTHDPSKTGRLVKPSLRIRSSKAMEAVAITKEVKEMKHPAAESIETIASIAVVNQIEGMKFVEKTPEGAVINVPSSGDIIANNDAELPTGGSLSYLDVDYKIAQDAPLQTTCSTMANIEAINTITRDMNKQDYMQDQEKIKSYIIAGGKSDNMVKVKPRAEEVEAEESTFEQGFMDYVGHATKQASSTTETVSTFLGRMGKSVVELKQIEKDATLTILRKHMFEVLPTIDEIEAAEKWDDTCTRAVLDAYLKMDLKDKNVMAQSFDQDTVSALEDYTVTGFNKTQWKSKVWYKVAVKVGQSVSQHSKTKNMIMKFHAYVCDALLREYDGYKPFLYASGKPDAQIERKLSEMMESADEDCIFIEGDFSEFDSTQNELMPILCTELLQYYTGLNNELLSTYINHLKKWKVDIPGAMTIYGRHQKHSGEAATLLFNTIWNTVWVTALFELEEPVVCAFKGDDSLIVAKSVKTRKEVEKLMKINGLQLKMSKNKFYGTFTDMIVTRNGATIDLGRRAQKLLSKSYKLTDLNCKKELRESVHDIVKQRIVNAQGQAAAITNNSIVYGSELARNYCEVLINISRDDFSGWKSDAVKKVVLNMADEGKKVDLTQINL
nr:nonstructural polyprotein [Murray-Darling carp hepevirus]